MVVILRRAIARGIALVKRTNLCAPPCANAIQVVAITSWWCHTVASRKKSKTKKVTNYFDSICERHYFCLWTCSGNKCFPNSNRIFIEYTLFLLYVTLISTQAECCLCSIEILKSVQKVCLKCQLRALLSFNNRLDSSA